MFLSYNKNISVFLSHLQNFSIKNDSSKGIIWSFEIDKIKKLFPRYTISSTST